MPSPPAHYPNQPTWPISIIAFFGFFLSPSSFNPDKVYIPLFHNPKNAIPSKLVFGQIVVFATKCAHLSAPPIRQQMTLHLLDSVSSGAFFSSLSSSLIPFIVALFALRRKAQKIK
jgi:hypothetical protein